METYFILLVKVRNLSRKGSGQGFKFPVFLWQYGRHYALSLYGVFERNLGQGISVANSLGPRDPKCISRAE